MLKPDLIDGAHRRNTFHSVLLFLGMLMLLAFQGWLLWGIAGLAIMVVSGAVLMIGTGGGSPRPVMRRYHATELASAEAPELYRLTERLARAAGLKRTPVLWYVPTPDLNAFSVGSPNQAAIGLTDGLLRSLSLRELSAVLAHETGHIAHNDMRSMALADSISRMTRFLALFGQILVLINLPLLLLGKVTVSWFGILLLLATPSLVGLLQLALARTREYQADLAAARLTGDPEGLAQALEKLEASRPSIWLRVFGRLRPLGDPSLLRTHPSTVERKQRLLALSGQDRLFEPGTMNRRLTSLPLPVRHHRPRRWF